MATRPIWLADSNQGTEPPRWSKKNLNSGHLEAISRIHQTHSSRERFSVASGHLKIRLKASFREKNFGSESFDEKKSCFVLLETEMNNSKRSERRRRLFWRIVVCDGRALHIEKKKKQLDNFWQLLHQLMSDWGKCYTQRKRLSWINSSIQLNFRINSISV